MNSDNLCTCISLLPRLQMSTLLRGVEAGTPCAKMTTEALGMSAKICFWAMTGSDAERSRSESAAWDQFEAWRLFGGNKRLDFQLAPAGAVDPGLLVLFAPTSAL